MGAALFVVLERPIDGIDTSGTNGKFLAQCSDELDAVAEELKVKPLGQLVSISPDEVEGMLDLGGIDPDELDGLPEEFQNAVAGNVNEINRAFGAMEAEIAKHGVPPEEWFEASEGLQTVQRLLTYLRTSQDRITSAEDVVSDLEEIEQILKAADQASVRFHLSFDI